MRPNRQSKDNKDGYKHYDQDREEFFDDSIDNFPPMKNQEFDQIGQICERERELMTNRIKPKRQNQPEQRSSSQFVPNSEDSFSHSSKIDNQASRNLLRLIKEFQKQLSEPRQKQLKMKQLSEITKLGIEIVQKKVYDYFRRKKDTSNKNSSNFQERGQHQTIYKKTEMFDDAIKKVLKVTPYACINDLKDQIFRKLNLDLAKETLIRRLKNLNYIYTKFELTKKDRSNDILTLSQIRKRSIKLYRQINVKGYPIYFYASCHIATDQCKGSMWMKIKQNGALDHILYEKDVVHVCVILSKEKIQYFKIFQGFYRAQSYQQTINQWAAHRFQAKNNRKPASRRATNNPPAICYLISQVNQLHGSLLQHSDDSINLQQSGVTMIAFPPYSYSMNPAQVLFNQLKYLVKSKVKQLQQPQFSKAIEQVIVTNLDKNDIKFAHDRVSQQYSKWK